MRDFSRRTEKIAICRGEWEISRSVAENVKNRDLSRRIGNFAVSYMPRNPFVPGLSTIRNPDCGSKESSLITRTGPKRLLRP